METANDQIRNHFLEGGQTSNESCSFVNTPISSLLGNSQVPLPFIVKYKPYYIRDFCMDPKIFLFLSTLLKMDDMNVLLVGNPNTGKTTMIYAIIREYYELAKMDPIPEKNILFINNLKEQGISYFRTEMKNFCQTYSTIPGKKKMIVIDDIDLINEQSQQIFRNYIDKYKHNIHFVSVCSNIQKVIESLQSRLHILYTLAPSKEEVEGIVENIVSSEGIFISEEAKQYLLNTHNYSTRALINHLEKIKLMGFVKENTPLTLATCKQLCSNLSVHQFEQYIVSVLEHKLIEAIQILYQIVEEGYSVIDILDFFFTFVKSTHLLDEDQKYKCIPHLCKYIYYFHHIHEEAIELALLTKELISVL